MKNWYCGFSYCSMYIQHTVYTTVCTVGCPKMHLFQKKFCDSGQLFERAMFKNQNQKKSLCAYFRIYFRTLRPTSFLLPPEMECFTEKDAFWDTLMYSVQCTLMRTVNYTNLGRINKIKSIGHPTLLCMYTVCLVTDYARKHFSIF